MAKPKAPSFQPDAIATRSGWAHPQTGEILVAVSGLLDAVAVEDKPVAVVTETVDAVKADVVIDAAKADAKSRKKKA